ncbi:mitochondrial potassium channel-like [Artemia franciscana]|uniref:mitochondrial potassium channel-like n=1 Tax=Artemia franciscana TaxID=6661 RepID=UPI0032DA1DE8
MGLNTGFVFRTMLKYRRLTDSLGAKWNASIKKYEDFIGISEVKEAQNRVLLAETRFIDAQEKRRSVQMALNSIQEKLKDIHLELDRTPRGDDRYLKLITQEHSIIREERKLRDEGLLYEKSERDNFSALSNAVRDSHERERAQGERTKYWSIMGSILGTVVGLFGSSAINRMRMKEIKELVVEAAGSRNDLTLQLHDIVQRSPGSSGMKMDSQTLLEDCVRRAMVDLTASLKDYKVETEKVIIDKFSDINESLDFNLSSRRIDGVSNKLLDGDTSNTLQKVAVVTSTLTLILVVVISAKIFS